MYIIERYPTQIKFEKLFQEQGGQILFDSGFVYTQKFRCYYRFVSSDILQVFSNQIYSHRSAWRSYIGIYPLCEPSDFQFANSLSWYNFYFWEFDPCMRIYHWAPQTKENLDKANYTYCTMKFPEKLQASLEILREYAIPQMNKIQNFSNYMLFLQEMPQYIAPDQTMGPLLGRYGKIDAINAQIENYQKCIEEYTDERKKWSILLFRQYSQIRKQLLQNGPESFELILQQYATATKARLDAEMRAPLRHFRRI